MALPFTSFPRALAAAAVAAVLAGTGCAPRLSVEDADVPAWQATAMPSAAGVVAEKSGKLLSAEPVDRTEELPAGAYAVTLVCEGGGKAFLAVRSGEKDVADLGAACYGTPERAKVTLATDGPLEFSISSVDAPVLYAYHIVPAG
ncbi:hypothetical protein ACIQC0_10620 [Pseudarthrobacter sp. NPDC092419]|uniref:hypothetical protein n=1 Tax=Pseudarthrobacter sp. NPDC092419 TaxID=3364414 RepID=UPI0037FC61AC